MAASERPEPLRVGAGRKISWDQVETWVVSQAIRRIVHEALREMRAAVRTSRASHRRQLYPEEEQEMLRAMRYCSFQLATVIEYMEPPGTPELDQAYERYVIGTEQ